MKHRFSVTVLLLGLFLAAQLLGLGIVYKYVDVEKSAAEGQTVFKELPVLERPPMDEKTSFIPIMITILIGTGIMLLLLKYNLEWIWKLWFLFAVVMALTIAFGAFLVPLIAFGIALILGVWKIFRPNFYVQTLTELFIYGGLAAIFVPVFNILSVSILMVLIAIYDAYAVWKSKHMVTLAKSQTKAKVFAGLLVPYKMGKVEKKTKVISGNVSAQKKTPAPVRMAVLGGGDIGFPLIFAGVVMVKIGIWQSLVIVLCSFLALAGLLWFSKEKKFYPAMPFIGAGCFLGLGIVWLISFLF